MQELIDNVRSLALALPILVLAATFVVSSLLAIRDLMQAKLPQMASVRPVLVGILVAIALYVFLDAAARETVTNQQAIQVGATTSERFWSWACSILKCR